MLKKGIDGKHEKFVKNANSIEKWDEKLNLLSVDMEKVDRLMKIITFDTIKA